jgi:hypothetical protein
MNDKYYTPEIEEFHVGFEYEVEDFSKGHKNGVQWVKKTIKSIGRGIEIHEGDYDNLAQIEALDDVYVRNTYRVKYLDREDIEEVFEYYERVDGSRDMYKLFKPIFRDRKDKWITVYHVPQTSWVLMYVGEDKHEKHDVSNLFTGTIKNKSELKRIMKMIGV